MILLKDGDFFFIFLEIKLVFANLSCHLLSINVVEMEIDIFLKFFILIFIFYYNNKNNEIY